MGYYFLSIDLRFYLTEYLFETRWYGWILYQCLYEGVLGAKFIHTGSDTELISKFFVASKQRLNILIQCRHWVTIK